MDKRLRRQENCEQKNANFGKTFQIQSLGTFFEAELRKTEVDINEEK